MSRENIELVRRAYEYHARTGEVSGLAFHPDIEWHSASDLPDRDVYRGIDAVRSFIEGWPSAFEGFRGEINEIIERDEYVVVSLVMRGRLKATDEEVTLPETHVWKLRDGKAIEVREYRTTEAALEALAASD